MRGIDSTFALETVGIDSIMAQMSILPWQVLFVSQKRAASFDFAVSSFDFPHLYLSAAAEAIGAHREMLNSVQVWATF